MGPTVPTLDPYEPASGQGATRSSVKHAGTRAHADRTNKWDVRGRLKVSEHVYEDRVYGDIPSSSSSCKEANMNPRAGPARGTYRRGRPKISEVRLEGGDSRGHPGNLKFM